MLDLLLLILKWKGTQFVNQNASRKIFCTYTHYLNKTEMIGKRDQNAMKVRERDI